MKGVRKVVISIGKAVLYQMLGIQESYYTPAKIPSTCKGCPWIEAALSNPSPTVISNLKVHCSSCANYRTDILQYVSEKNKYGSKEKVCRNAISLFIMLHMYHPSQSGYINNLSIHTLAEKLNISERTIKNCLSVLSKKNYIFVDYMRNGLFNVILLDYTKYFLRADKGGRGYIKISDMTITELFKIKSILAFRVILRQLLDGQDNDCEKTYQQLRHTLPAYCKRNVIQKALTIYNNIIYSMKTASDTVHFSLLSIANTNYIIQKDKDDNIQYFDSILKELDDFILSGKPVSDIPVSLNRFVCNPINETKISDPVLFQRNNTETLLDDLAKLSIKYSRQTVLDALADTYRDKMCQKQSLIRDVGAYVLTIIKNNMKSAV